jgi:hypothetical protein
VSNYLDRLNLRPNERRFVVFVFLVLFVVLNIFFVWPYRTARADATQRLERAGSKLKLYRAEVKQMEENKKNLQAFERDSPVVPPEDQSIQFLRVIQSQAAVSGVNITGTSRATTKTNDFFLEQNQTVSIQSGEEQLVNFLYSLGAGESLIRVRELSLRPDQPRQNLGGSLTLVASYQKKPPAKAAPASTARATATAAAPPAKPAAATPTVPAPATPKPTAKFPVAKPPAAKPATTNAPSAGSWWGTVKGWFGGSSAAPATSPTNKAPSTVPAAKPKPATATDKKK